MDCTKLGVRLKYTVFDVAGAIASSMSSAGAAQGGPVWGVVFVY